MSHHRRSGLFLIQKTAAQLTLNKQSQTEHGLITNVRFKEQGIKNDLLIKAVTNIYFRHYTIKSKQEMMFMLENRLVTIVLWCAFVSHAGGVIHLNLQKAMDKKYIVAQTICKGGLELKYTIHNLLKDTVFMTIPAGWRFNSDDPTKDYQDILIVHDVALTLKPKETKFISLKGHCCEASKSGPLTGVPYNAGHMADNNLVKLAHYLNEHDFDSNTEQYSIWAISDQRETAHIANINDSATHLLRVFVAGLKGEPLPWYTLLKKAIISGNGTVNDYPILFKAEVKYTISKPCYAYCYIVNSSGQNASTIIGQWLQPDTSTYHAHFKMKGLKKGNYTLILEHENSVLVKKTFTI